MKEILTHDFGPSDYVRAVLNILEDFADERDQQRGTQRAVLNILEDFGSEKSLLEDTQRAVLNILDDLSVEKGRLEATQQEVLRSEQAVRASLREKEVLLKEVHHRVKNNLQVISSLLNLQARYLQDPAARAIFNDSQNRVQSIALVHEKLYRSADLSHIDFGDYAGALIDNLFQASNAPERGIEWSVDMGGVRLAIDLAIPCGLIVNELITNSLKHAFPANRHGRVHVMMKRLDADQIELVVEDDGVGLPVQIDPHSARSLGLDLVFTFAEQIEAEVSTLGGPAGRGARFQFHFRAERA